jgi:CRISPR-associated protein Cas2
MYRFMRIIAMYDLPTLTPLQRKAYRLFNRSLIKAGFVRLQFSVYTKLVLNSTQKARYEEFLRRHKPIHGSLIMLTVTERQFANMEFLLGQEQTAVLQNDQRLVIW